MATSTLIKSVLVPKALLDVSFETDADAIYALVDIALAEGRIQRVSKSDASNSAAEHTDVVDGGNGRFLLLPGFINGHTHSIEFWHRGQIGMLPLELWLEKLFQHSHDCEQYYWAAVATAVECLCSGGTTVMDHLFLQPDIELECLQAAYRGYGDVGVRVVIAPLMRDMHLNACLPLCPIGHPKPANLPPLQERLPLVDATVTKERLATLARLAPLVHKPELGQYLAVGPTGFNLCSDDFLIGCNEISRRHNLLKHNHFLETRVQFHVSRERYGSWGDDDGESAAEHLKNIGFLDHRTMCAHGVHLSDRDVAAVAASGASLVHNPLSNLRLGSGIAPIRKYRDAGINVALGCDGQASNDSQDMLEVVKMATILHNVTTPDYRQWLTPLQGVLMACQGGARALAMQDQLGSVAVGQLADLVMYDLHDLSMLPLGDPLGSLVLQRPSRHVVQHAWVSGKKVLSNGNVVGIDVARLQHEIMRRSALHLNVDTNTTSPSIEPEYRRALGLSP